MRNSRLIAGSLWTGLLLGCCAGTLSAPQSAAAQSAAAPSAPVMAPTYDIEAYDVDGAKLLSQLEVETAVYPYLGPGLTRDSINGAVAALQKAYGDRGYQTVVVELPSQTLSETGANYVKLHVVEAPVGRLRVTGSRFYSPNLIRSQLPAFQEGQVPNINEAQKELADVNRLPDRQVTPAFPRSTLPETVDIDLQVKDNLPLHASVELNNDHSQNTPQLRLLSTIHYDNLWQLGHSVSFTYAVAPEDRAASEIFAGSYTAPIWGSPWSLMASGYTSNSNVATLGGTSVLGKGYAVGATAILQLPSLGSLTQSLDFGFNFKNFNQDINTPGAPGVGQASTTLVQTVPILYWPLNFAYNVQRSGTIFNTTASLSLTENIRGLGSNPDAFENARHNASANFLHLNLDLTQTEALGHGFEAFEHLTTQYSDQPLVSNEQFAAGGFTSVRGYLQAEATGDDGFVGTVELRSPSFASHLGPASPYIDTLSLYAFEDGGVVRVLDPLAGQTDLYTLWSTGLGLRLSLLKHFSGEVAAAVPLITGVATKKDEPRVSFSLKSEY